MRQSGTKSISKILTLVIVLAFTMVIMNSFSTAEEEAELPVYKNKEAPIEDRVQALLDLLTLEEKVSLVHGRGMDTGPIERLGIPSLNMADGPHGLRWGEASAFPTGVGMGSTWNEELVGEIGAAMAREFLAKGRNVILGPCINIHRNPFGGRNFESMSEDPFLTGRLTVGYVKGAQEYNAMATPKHYAVNNQEYERMTISAEISERALREIYLPHFKMAIQEGGAWTIMCSYNRLNGIYACENEHLLTDILKNEWGFKGYVMSDWGAVHSTIPTVMSGMDLEMGSGRYLDDELQEAVEKGEVPESVVDEMVRRTLRSMIATGLYDRKIFVDAEWLDSAQNRATALQAARESIILLKNEGAVLPIDRKKVKKVAVIGPNAAIMQVGGGGSSTVTPFYRVSPLEGMLKQAGGDVEVKYAKGCDTAMEIDYEIIPSAYLLPSENESGEHGLTAEYFMGKVVAGEPVAKRLEKQVDHAFSAEDRPPGVTGDNFIVRWTGKLVPPVSGKYKLTVVANGIANLSLNGKALINQWDWDGNKGKSKSVKLKAGREYKIRYEFQSTGGRPIVQMGWRKPGQDSIKEAAQLAAESDVAVVFAGLDNRFEGEGNDRDDLELPGLQNDLIEAVAAANPNTVVVLINGTPLMMGRWLDNVPALVEAWYPGHEGGRAIAEILFGDVNPSGKMPITYPNSWEEMPAFGNYPGKDGKVHYDEGIFVGYRYYDREKIKPLFPFGFGMSYTSFEYSDMKISPSTTGTKAPEATVSLTVKNTGDRAGKEAVQLYVTDTEASLQRPPLELKGISKIHLEPGESKTVEFALDFSSFAFFSEDKMKWVAEPGQFDISVGASSRDIRITGSLDLE